MINFFYNWKGNKANVEKQNPENQRCDKDWKLNYLTRKYIDQKSILKCLNYSNILQTSNFIHY